MSGDPSGKDRTKNKLWFSPKVAEYESMSPRDEEYRRLLDRLERVTSENQQLRDSNDELLSQLDAFPLRQNNGRNKWVKIILPIIRFDDEVHFLVVKQSVLTLRK